MMKSKQYIQSIRDVDSAISANAKRIEDISENERHLSEIIESAKQKEIIQNKKYINHPTEKNQQALESARDFYLSSKKRFNLFVNNAGQIEMNTKRLWSKRKYLLEQLAKVRIMNMREGQALERKALFKKLYPDVVRLILLTSHLDGIDIHQLDFNRMTGKLNQQFKADLESARADLKALFEAL